MDVQSVDARGLEHTPELILAHSLQFARIEGRLGALEEEQKEYDKNTKDLASEVRRLADAILTIEAERRTALSFRRWVVPIMVSVVVGVLSTAVTLWAALAAMAAKGG